MRLSVIFEGAEEKMAEFTRMLTGKKSRIRDRFVNPDGSMKDSAGADISQLVHDMIAIDKTEKYIPFIVKQVAFDNIKLSEDGNRLAFAIDKFKVVSKKPGWTGLKEIMQYDNWRKLEKDVKDYFEKYPEEEATAAANLEKELLDKMKAGCETMTTFSLNTTKGLIEYKLFKCETPEATAYCGRGSSWCTTYSLFNNKAYSEFEKTVDKIISSKRSPWKTSDSLKKLVAALNDTSVAELEANKSKVIKAVESIYFTGAMDMASRYMASGPMWILYKGGKPFMQFTNDGSDIMNQDDERPMALGQATTVAVKKMLPFITGKLNGVLSGMINQA